MAVIELRSDCCGAPASEAELFVSRRSGLRWRRLLCADCGREVTRYCAGIADQAAWWRYLEQCWREERVHE